MLLFMSLKIGTIWLLGLHTGTVANTASFWLVLSDGKNNHVWVLVHRNVLFPKEA